MENQGYYNAPPKKSNIGLILAIVVGVIALCCIAPGAFLGFMGYNAVEGVLGYVGCGATAAEMRNGVLAYAKAHGGKFPAADHWQDDIAKYVQPIHLGKKGGMKLPPMNGDVCDETAESSFMYNAGLAGKKLASVEDQSSTIVIWEAPGRGRNRSAQFAPLAGGAGPKWIGNMHRGWIEVPVAGQAFFVAKGGVKSAIPDVNSQGGGDDTIDIQTHSN